MAEDRNEQSGNPKTSSAAAGAQFGGQGQRDQQEEGQEKNQPGGQTGQGGQGTSQQNYQGGGQQGDRNEPAPTTQQDKERERQ